MNDELKMKLILALLGNVSTEAQMLPVNLQSGSLFVGKICMIRTHSAGVHFGELVSKNGQNVVLKNARRVWYWAKACSLSQLAMEGDKDLSNCKIAMLVENIELDQVIEVIPMSSGAIKIMYGAQDWKV
jgi:hypothetical protein